MDQEKETKRQAERCRALAQRIVRELTPASIQVLGGSGALAEALEKAGRRDLIGYTKHCLIRPVPPRPGETSAGGGHGTGKKGGKPHGGGAGKGPKGSKGHGGMSRAQNTAGRNRAAQGRQGANGGGRRN